ncbi:hypothetical protein A5735_05025 [Mycolicibacter heraklionensis]|nr:hypothetical protein A5735_05025 [Mycolicibacter heraklionensis]
MHYRDFDLGREVRDICSPLATEVAEIHSMPTLVRERSRLDDAGKPVPGPFPLHHYIEALAKEVHQIRRRTTEWLARRVDAEGRSRLAAVVSDAAHGRCPDVAEDDLRTALWLGSLVGHVSPLSADLAAVVAATPAPRRLGNTEVDVFIVDVLKPLEIEVSILRQRIPDVRYQQVRAHQSRVAFERQVAEREAGRVSADLRRIGMD